jgi:hypothetical protein
MALDIFKEKGTPLDRQQFTWRDIVRAPFSKLDDDAFTRVRVILMNGIEEQATRFQHHFARMNEELRPDLARLRRMEHFQQLTVNWLLPSDQSPLETTIGYEQVAIEVTASLAQLEPDPYLAQAYRFALLEDFDHLYRYSALLDRLEGKDPNAILQNYTDIRPGRPTSQELRHPEDDLRRHYDRAKASPRSKIHALTLVSAEQQTLNYYKNVGPTFSDPVARQLYAEIATIEEQHVTHYESLLDPGESMLEKWLLHEAHEVYNYYGCMHHEGNPVAKEIWTRFVDYELGHLHHVMDLFRKYEKRDPAEVLPREIPEPIAFRSHREFVRRVLEDEVDLRADGPDFVPSDRENPRSVEFRDRLNAEGSPSEIVAAGYRWHPGTELTQRIDVLQGA